MLASRPVEGFSTGELLWALARRFGVASVFWTIAFDDVHDPRVLRLSFRAPPNGKTERARRRASGRA